ncbi:MAG TPA: TonB-dependent receptor [Steroidobacteraceae bacterium]|jgi:outer membrane receptor protein involved in Fe transport
MRTALIATGICVSVGGLCHADGAKAAITRIETSIPSQALGPALTELAQSRDMQVLYFTSEVTDLRTSGASGNLTADEALSRLLSGTGLTYRYVDATAVTIVPAGAGHPADPPTGRVPPAGASGTVGHADEADEAVAQRKEGKSDSSGPFRLAQVAGGATAGSPAVAADSGASSATSLQEVVVTGTRFKTPNASSPAPITIVGASDLLHEGAAKTEDLMISLPQTDAGLTDSGVGISQTPLTGTATVDLRGIGAFRTLVLMNGQRINPGDAVNPSADLHTIPELLIKRVEVLTGGASAIYGSDAEAGVVNFVMDTDYTGTKFSAQGSGFYDNNGDTGLHSIMSAGGVNPPTGSVFDGGTVNLAGVYGTGFSGGAGHVELYAGYRRSAGFLASSRDTSACTLQETTPTSYGCLLDGSAAAGQFVDPSGNAYTLGAAGNTLRPYAAGDGYNFTAPESLQRPDTRWNAGVFAHYTFNEHAQLYLEGQFMHDYTTLQYEPSGTAWTNAGPQTYSIPCSDPLLSADEVSTLCSANGLAATDVAQIGIGRRNVEGGSLQDSFRHTSSRLVLGVKGALDENWTYDANVNYGKVTYQERVTNDISIANVTNALDVVSVGGKPTCQSVVDGTDPSCVPYDIWRTGGVTPAALGYITEGGGNVGSATQTILSTGVIGDLGAYGLKSPWASDSLGLALGAQYRDEAIDNQPGAAMSAGDLMYASNVLYGSLPTKGSFHVAEIYSELKVPLLKDKPFAESLNLDLADRYASYRPQGKVNAYNLGADWALIRTVRFRASYSRAVRAANGHELFLAQSAGTQQIADPCSGPTPTASQAECALTGVTAAQYGHIPLANGVTVLSGGNPNLTPEKGSSFTAGVVLTNFDWAPSLLLSVDYWRIRIKDYIGSIAAKQSLSGCLASGNPIFCNLVIRGAGGSLVSGRILQTRANTGSYGESGIDIAGQYLLPLGPAGRLSFTFNGSRLLDNPISVNPAVPLVDCSDLYGASCSGVGPTSPIPYWRHTLRSTWTKGNVEVSLNWRYIGAMSFEGTSPYFSGETVNPIDSHVPAYNYFDLDTGYTFEHFDVHLGVNNLFGKKPPIIGYGANPLLLNGNLFTGIYDNFGREIFAEMTAQF